MKIDASIILSLLGIVLRSNDTLCVGNDIIIDVLIINNSNRSQISTNIL